MGNQSHVSTRCMGTYGYAAPEYMATGVCIYIYIYAISFVHFQFIDVSLGNTRKLNEMCKNFKS